MSEFGGYESDPFVADLYDHTIHYAARPDIGFYLDQAKSTTGPILELGCGTGRVLTPLAEAGRTIVGLDVSEHMLAKCREKLRNLPRDVQERVQLLAQNMVHFNLHQTFGMVIFPFRSFQHLLAVEDQLSCLTCANRHVVMGGRLVLDLFHVDPAHLFDPALHEEQIDFRDVKLPDGRVFTRSQRVAAFHRTEQYNDIELIHTITYPDGRTERLVQSFPWRHFFRYEVEHLLHRCGFKLLQVYGDYDKSPLSENSPDMIFVAEKYVEM